MVEGLTLAFALMLAQQAPADRVLQDIRQSGRLVVFLDSSSERVAPAPGIAPGSPPVLAFRFFDGRERHRFGKLDLVLDDAGH